MKQLTLILLFIFISYNSFANTNGSGTLGNSSKGGRGKNASHLINGPYTETDSTDNVVDTGDHRVATGAGNGSIVDMEKLQRIEKLNPALIYYQGESQSELHFRIATPKNNKWQIEKHTIGKGMDILNTPTVFEALIKSQVNRGWTKIQPSR